MLLWEEEPAGALDGDGYSRCRGSTAAGRTGCPPPTRGQTDPAGELDARRPEDWQTVELQRTHALGETRSGPELRCEWGAPPATPTPRPKCWTQALTEIRIGSHGRRGARLHGRRYTAAAPRQLKVGRHPRYWATPGLNCTIPHQATDDRTANLPARLRRFAEKAKVEVGVLVVERMDSGTSEESYSFSLSGSTRRSANWSTILNAAPTPASGCRLSLSFFWSLISLGAAASPRLLQPCQGRLAGSGSNCRDVTRCPLDTDGHLRLGAVSRSHPPSSSMRGATAAPVEPLRKGERLFCMCARWEWLYNETAQYMPSPIGVMPSGRLKRICNRRGGIGRSTAKLTELILECRPHPEQGHPRRHRHSPPRPPRRRRPGRKWLATAASTFPPL